jgi:hypothetical protein
MKSTVLICFAIVLSSGACAQDRRVADVSPNTPSPNATATGVKPVDKAGLSEPLKLTVPRATHAAVLLADGRVLVVGGFETAGTQEIPIASAEIYAPKDGAFHAIQSMKQARSGATATRLQDGTVLITGGWGADGRLASAELFDPNTNTFRQIAPLHRPRASHTATLLNNGDVMIVGGDSARRTLNLDIEVFNPKSKQFAIAGRLKHGRAAHTATLLKSGEVLVTGGGDLADAIEKSAEVISPETGASRVVGEMQVVRHKHSAQLLPDGSVLIVGGSDRRDWTGKYATAEIYAPQAERFEPLIKLQNERFKLSDAVGVFADGTVLIAGGSRTLERFDPKDKKSRAAGSFEKAFYYQTLTILQDGRALIIGGYDDRIKPAQSAWIFN